MQETECTGKHLQIDSAIARLKRQLPVPLWMEVIILLTWSIWKARNGWIFDNIPPVIESVKEIFKKELRLILHRDNY